MATYNGDELVVYFKRYDGTATLSGVQRTLEIDITADTADHTAGTMDYRRRKTTLKDANFSLTALYEGAGGTATHTVAAIGAEGTLEVAPLGTSTGNPKGQYPVIVTGKNTSIPYDGEVVTSWSFDINGDPVTDVHKDVY